MPLFNVRTVNEGKVIWLGFPGFGGAERSVICGVVEFIAVVTLMALVAIADELITDVMQHLALALRRPEGSPYPRISPLLRPYRAGRIIDNRSTQACDLGFVTVPFQGTKNSTQK
jgi:hypothetical protein